MAGIFFIVLAGEHDDLHFRGTRQQVADQGKTFIRPVRERWQSEIDQRQLRGLAQLTKQGHGVRTGMAGDDIEFLRESKAERFGN